MVGNAFPGHLLRTPKAFASAPGHPERSLFDPLSCMHSTLCSSRSAVSQRKDTPNCDRKIFSYLKGPDMSEPGLIHG